MVTNVAILGIQRFCGLKQMVLGLGPKQSQLGLIPAILGAYSC